MLTFTETVELIGDPPRARANMLEAPLDGRARTATELLGMPGLAPRTASGHFRQLIKLTMLALERQGGHRFHSLASPTVAHSPQKAPRR